MANLHRIRSNFKQGTLGANLLTTVTTIDFGSDPGFATLGTDEYLVLIIDPEGAANGPEIVYLTAYTATNTTGTIERGKEGTSDPGVTHASGTDWIHGPTARDNDWAPWSIVVYEPSAVANLDIDISGFEAVEIVGWVKAANDNVNFVARFSNDGGSSFRSGGADYTSLRDFSYVSGAGGSGAAGSFITIAGGVGNDTGEMVGFSQRILNPAESGARTTMTGLSTYMQNSAARISERTGGFVETEEVNDYLRLLFDSGNIDSGRVTVYGYPAAE